MFLFTTSEASTLEEGGEMEETTTLSGGTDGDAAPTGTQASSLDPDIVDTDYSDDIGDDFGKPPTVEVQSCMIFTENIVVGKISANIMNSGNVMPFIY